MNESSLELYNKYCEALVNYYNYAAEGGYGNLLEVALEHSAKSFVKTLRKLDSSIPENFENRIIFSLGKFSVRR